MDYELRALKEDDYDSIQEIASTTWGGYDHLPKMFKEWMSNSNCHPIGLIFNHALVALGCVRLIEGGTTAWLEGLRVHPEYRGKGLSSQVTYRIKDLAKKLGATRTRLTTAINNPIPSKLAKSIGMESIISLEVHWASNIEIAEARNNVVACDVKEFVDIAASNSALVPENIISYFWYALDAKPSSIPNLLSIEGIRFFKIAESNNLLGIALGFPHTTSEGIEWRTTLYPSSGPLLESLLAHQRGILDELTNSWIMYQYPSKFLKYMKEQGYTEKADHSLTLALFQGNL